MFDNNMWNRLPSWLKILLAITLMAGGVLIAIFLGDGPIARGWFIIGGAFVVVIGGTLFYDASYTWRYERLLYEEDWKEV